uniref:Reverse transcriptase Ty1/copia-type domain-containing protein n=1 Tax=Tanacetum cinerariifolium TaxID=118510 RepID=A0A6L2LIY9_TANCI|nr:hypothetical protein [Tanacetum cinerariifolium]
MDYEYYKTKMLLAKKDKDEQVLLAEDHAWMESSSDSDREINANMVFVVQMEKVLSDSEESSSSKEETIAKNDDLLAQTKALQEQLKVKHVVIDNHVECQAKYAKLEVERYEYMIRYSSCFDNDKQHRKQVADQEILFDKMSRKLVELDENLKKSLTTNVETSNNEGEVFHEVSKSFQGESFSSSLNDDVHQSPEEGIISQTNNQSISNDMIHNVDEASLSHNVFNERLEDAYFDISTVFHDTSNVHEFYQPYPHETKWTKDHPLHKIIGDPKSSVCTRGQLENSCLFACLLSSIEPGNVAEALKDADWVIALQDELDQFTSKQYPVHVYALDKALYGLKQAPRAWYDVLSKFLIDSGFQKDHAGCHLDRKSTSGSVQFLSDKLVCWSSKKQNYVSISIAEPEYVAISGCYAQYETRASNNGFYAFQYETRALKKKGVRFSAYL